MFANRYTALIDACSLAGSLNRNFLLTLAEAEFFRVRWSEPILDETERALVKMFTKRTIDDAAVHAKSQINRMKRAFPEALVEDFDSLQPLCGEIPDQGDWHVLAAALKIQAQAIVTENLKDFPDDVLGPLNLEARTSDDFIADTISLDETRAVFAIRQMRERMKNPPKSADSLLRDCEARGLIATADQLRPFIDLI